MNPVHRKPPPAVNKLGMALFGVIMILSTTTLLVATVYTVVSTNVSISGHHKRQQQSFFQADAGLHCGQAAVAQALADGTLTLNSPTTILNFQPPAGYTFDPITNLVRLANKNLYLMKVKGRSFGAETTVEAILGQPNALGDIGLFGDRALRLQPGFEVYSYDSTVTLNPTPADSTGKAGVGSNQSVIVQPGANADGSIFLGADAAGNPAVYSGTGAIPLKFIGRVSPDPLGAVGGPLAQSFLHYGNSTKNDNAAAGISGNRISLGTKKSMTLYPGIYYLTELTVGTQATLDIISDADHPVVIFLTGEFQTQSSSVISSVSGSPKGLYIFSTSTGEFRIQPNSEFRGFVYAPYADLRVQPGNGLYGAFWGGEALLQPNGDLYIDTSLIDDFKSGNLQVVQWREVR